MPPKTHPRLEALDSAGFAVSLTRHARPGHRRDCLARIWRAASAGVTERPASILAVLGPVNDVIDIHSLRIAAGKRHLPWLVMGLLIACSLLSVAGIGYRCGIGERRRALLTLSLALLLATPLWITIDLDHPRAGLMRISDAPLKALKLDASSG